MFCGRLTEDAQEIHIKFAKNPQEFTDDSLNYHRYHRDLTRDSNLESFHGGLTENSQMSHRGLQRIRTGSSKDAHWCNWRGLAKRTQDNISLV